MASKRRKKRHFTAEDAVRVARRLGVSYDHVMTVWNTSYDLGTEGAAARKALKAIAARKRKLEVRT